MKKTFFIGLDIGASTTKAVVIDAEKEILGFALSHSGANFKAAADEVLKKSKDQARIEESEPVSICATGYGRRNVPAAHAVKTEISCHAKGAFHFFPQAHTLIDIGGQDSKVIKVDERGRRTGFKMNRKCAAGTGAFLEDIAMRLKIELEDLDALAREATQDVQLGSYCTVFTATEILTKIRQNVNLKDIVKGVFTSVIKRAVEMDSLEGNIVMTGGVAAHNPFLVEMFEERIEKKIFVPPLPQFTGAFGAALYALEDKGGQHA